MLDDLDSASDIDKGAWKKMYNNMSTNFVLHPKIEHSHLMTAQSFCATNDWAGFREGVAAGRDSVFQKGFDVGYLEGYMNGYSLGYIKGVMSIRNKFMEGKEADDSAKQLDPDLEKTSRGMCVLCLEEKQRTKEESNSVSDIIEKQSKSLKHCIERLKTD
ncbi:hypothetical protein C0J52_06948 [Blattella germanica]|nr:hypothetical protein C0J52_06948 [Blattella germanica]